VHRCLQSKAPKYLTDCCIPVSEIASQHRLLSASRQGLKWSRVARVRPGTPWFAGSIPGLLFTLSCSSKSHKIPLRMHQNSPFSDKKNSAEGNSTSDCGRDPASFLDHFKHWSTAISSLPTQTSGVASRGIGCHFSSSHTLKGMLFKPSLDTFLLRIEIDFINSAGNPTAVHLLIKFLTLVV